MSSEKSQFNLKTDTIDDFWHSEFLSTIRNQMLNAKIPKECVLCTTHELQGGTSLRQKTNKEYRIFDQYAEKMLAHYQYPTKNPIEIEIQLTNLCNLKCMMCSETESSTILTENKILKISNANHTDYIVTEKEIVEIKNWIQTKPRLINLRGGEPLMVPEIKRLLLWALENNLLDDTEIHLTTNATKVDNEWLQLLTRIPNLRVMVSIDGVGKVNDYIRYGSSWNTVEENTKKLSQIPGIKLFIHCALQNLNILSVADLINWCNHNQYYLAHQLVTYPEIFELHNLPKALLEEAKARLETVDDSQKNVKQLITIINQTESTVDTLWRNFYLEVNMRDTIRGVSIIDIVPELKEYWHA